MKRFYKRISDLFKSKNPTMQKRSSKDNNEIKYPPEEI